MKWPGGEVSQLQVLEIYSFKREVTMLTWKSGRLSWEKEPMNRHDIRPSTEIPKL